MSNPDHSKHWESVAEEIGVERLTEPPAPQALPPPKSSPPRRGKSSTTGVAERTPTDWAGLAQDLGIEQASEVEGSGPRVILSEEPAPEATQTEVAAADRKVERKEVEQEETVLCMPADGESSPTPERVAVEEDEIDFGDSELASSEEDDPQVRRRRRRRPRRRPGRKRTTETDDLTPPEELSDDAAASQTLDDPRSPEPEEPTDKPARSSHRNIPTWDEAVGVIIDANVEARGSRGKTGPPGRSRGRGRKH